MSASRPSPAASSNGPGVAAQTPARLGWRGWKQVLGRVRAEVKEDRIRLVAAAVAFFVFLAIPPALASLVAFYGLLADPANVQNQLASISILLPDVAYSIISEQMERLARSQTAGLGWGAIVGLVVAIWSANRGMGAAVEALNIAYNEKEERGFLALNLRTLMLTLGAFVMFILVIGLAAGAPAILGMFDLDRSSRMLIDVLRWPTLALLVLVALGVLYAYAPNRSPARFQWVTPGAIFALLGILALSALLSLYVTRFQAFNETYGSFAAVAVLLLWLFLSAFVVLVGAEVNAEAEHQTAKDTTTHPEKPMGERGAYVADNVAARPRGEPATQR